MLLNDFLAVGHSEMYIREQTKYGSGSKPVFHYHLTSGPVPADLLSREIINVSAVPIIKYNRQSACFQVLIKRSV